MNSFRTRVPDRGAAAARSNQAPGASGVATGAASSHGARSVVGTAAAVAELDAFFEAEEGALNLRGTADQGDLSSTLREALMAVDLRHCGSVDAQALRAAIGRGLPAGTLSPYELWLLCHMALGAKTGPTSSAAEVSIDSFTEDSVEAVARCQERLMEVVYGPQGTQQALWKLYLQLRPLPPGCVTTERGVVVMQQQQTSSTAGSSCGDAPEGGLVTVFSSAQALRMPPLSSEEARQLLDIVVDKVHRLPRTQRLPFLVQEGILQEAQAEVEQCQGNGHEVNTWSSITAHMLHVYMSLP